MKLIATLTTILLAWLFTGEIDTALKIGAFEFVTKMIIYYLHERTWFLVTKKSIAKNA